MDIQQDKSPGDIRRPRHNPAHDPSSDTDDRNEVAAGSSSGIRISMPLFRMDKAQQHQDEPVMAIHTRILDHSRIHLPRTLCNHSRTVRQLEAVFPI